ncbi:MAG TPA: hypothetical protein VE673_18980 [Pseudonocardiaceae bacterium]|nr:hypothetical protein [Pseudonocardiaceae bacterium]
MGSATAVTAVVGGCLLLGPTPQAQAADICSTNSDGTKSCVKFGSNVSFSATQTKGTTTISSGSFSWNPFCVTGTNSSGTTATFGTCPK